MKLYELITFTVRVRTVATAMACLEQRLAVDDAAVKLIGCWASEIGPLNQIAVLRGFADEASRQAERERYLSSADAFGIEAYLTDMRVENYTLFPFIQPPPAGRHGPFYELRVYDLVPSGLAPTLKGWEKAVGPRTGAQYSPVYAAFYATDGQLPRYLHIWPYASLEQRLDVRTRAVQDGVWPPENSGPQLRDMHSTIYLPASFSPLQ
ncbi:NIPSNAP family protein [Pseudomonas fluorescens]|uniref:NIPSNAP family protein n=1 Tax=Pseudomonas fluorescens TaxID=294 RepID=A0A944DRL9_PSEFL|nr:NIPSNAP family protein [Pseudomonas fluorescens]MBT2295757.1 NIPSNAP family protein [Pseudomonas fluorescens]MBT2306014.1 NIPSNAP family protein [Pseudomonas fluorescens]MBT2314629.1 NIPSNAP family protein [Pseudomonas fluorescens]MBT2315622.1 NIPSNAP family protein [Pseudomonas fluorescens]MBT2331459.1 NIPSNAP family protein [Pseudomonas fluorescens]